MGIGKSIQYNMFCENYLDCNGMEDYKEFPYGKSPRRYFKQLGWVKDARYDNVWYCKNCAEKLGLKNK